MSDLFGNHIVAFLITWLKNCFISEAIISKEDLLQYTPDLTSSVKISLRDGLTIHTPPAPSGGVILMFILNILEGRYQYLLICYSINQTSIHLGPVVQNFVSLMLSLSPEFVNNISTSKANSLLSFVDKM